MTDPGAESDDPSDQPKPPEPFAYRAKLVRVVDGDTIQVTIDLGFRTLGEHMVRLLGVNTPEIRAKDKEERQKAQDAKRFTLDWIEERSRVHEIGGGLQEKPWPLILKSHKGDSFGRWLAKVWSADSGECLNDALIEAGMAKVYRADED
jgi:micrococcal nuclease